MISVGVICGDAEFLGHLGLYYGESYSMDSYLIKVYVGLQLADVAFDALAVRAATLLQRVEEVSFNLPHC